VIYTSVPELPRNYAQETLDTGSGGEYNRPKNWSDQFLFGGTVAKASRTPVYEEVMVRLAGLVTQGRLKPGDRLPAERALAGRMRVSRATLREALRVMQLQGLIVSRRGAGNFIAGGKPEDLAHALHHLALQDIFELRLLIEPAIAALAAQRANREDVSRLESILQQQDRDVKANRTAGPTDAAFHATLGEATHNRALLQVEATLMKVISPSRNESLQTRERARLSLGSHRRILEAIRRGDPVEARQAMEEHIHSIDPKLFGLHGLGHLTPVPGSQEFRTEGGIH
jgi:GntR family transcriptional regulator, transcriptional repressor for pyruvate dehydrogenase complex